MKTPFPELDDVLDRFVAGARDALGDNFLGAYLVGSFAVGDADEYSDVDFVVVTRGELTEQAALQRLHGELYELPTTWAQHLEGSYASQDQWRAVDPTRRPFLFLDNGARELVDDPHCNTALVRWVLREHGIVLAGPPPNQIIAPVDPDDLRTEARAIMREFIDWALAWTKVSRWAQPYTVLSFCRMQYTLVHAEIVSKRRAGEWAMRELDPRWRSLIQAALDDRPDPWLRVHQDASPESVAETLSFIASF